MDAKAALEVLLKHIAEREEAAQYWRRIAEAERTEYLRMRHAMFRAVQDLQSGAPSTALHYLSEALSNIVVKDGDM